VAKDEARALDGAKEVARHGEAAAAHLGEIQRRSARAKDAAVDLGHFKIRVDLALDAQQMTGLRQIEGARARGGDGHRRGPAGQFMPQPPRLLHEPQGLGGTSGWPLPTATTDITRSRSLDLQSGQEALASPKISSSN